MSTLSRRRLLSLVPGIVAAPFVAGTALGYEPPPPVGVADNAELTQRVTVLELRDSGILAAMSMLTKDVRRVAAKQGNPGPNYPYEVRGKRT